MPKCKLDGIDGSRCPIDNAPCRKTKCEYYTEYSNGDRIRAMSNEKLAAFLSRKFCYGHAEPQLKDWLAKPAEGSEK